MKKKLLQQQLYLHTTKREKRGIFVFTTAALLSAIIHYNYNDVCVLQDDQHANCVLFE